MKKKFFTFAVAAMAVLGAQAQNMVNGHEYVDLGLPSGTLWATMNVGASSPTDCGTEYSDTSFGWGDYWVLPTEEQWNELVSNCTVTHNGTAAMAQYSNIYFTFTSNSNSNSIVTPGYIWDNTETGVRHYIMYGFRLSEGKYASYTCLSTGTVYSEANTYGSATNHYRPVINQSTISSVPDGWTVKAGANASSTQKVTVTSGTTSGINSGYTVMVTPANIPTGKKIKSIKVLPTE